MKEAKAGTADQTDHGTHEPLGTTVAEVGALIRKLLGASKLSKVSETFKFTSLSLFRAEAGTYVVHRFNSSSSSSRE
ncbi:hypothetical protein [Microbacterium sp. HMWF026]|uniref:hypothetical protein n=1 Tax=Microbacterium sp. HMWF026 TaxID=2056861 RepID=UPI0015E7EC78|nr:hypothetical protein [Microbacterium sp. HMWF026]